MTLGEIQSTFRKIFPNSKTNLSLVGPVGVDTSGATASALVTSRALKIAKPMFNPVSAILAGLNADGAQSQSITGKVLGSTGNIYNVAIRMLNFRGNLPNLNDDCEVGCSCPAFRYWLAYSDNKAKALVPKFRNGWARVSAPIRNPSSTPGTCKHLVAFIEALQSRGIIR
jgi:hypothetical protein